MKRLFLILSIAVLLSACVPEPTPTPIPTETPEPTATPTAKPTSTPLPTTTRTHTFTPAPTNTATNTPKPIATVTLVRTRTPTATRTPAGPSPTPSAAQLCASMLGKLGAGIYVMYIHPATELIWDTEPRQFRVGLCNTNPPTSTPQGKYKIAMSFPGGVGGATQSAPSQIEIKAGFNEISVGPWVPGLQNHRAACVSRENAITEVWYNDTPDPAYRVLPWINGADHVTLKIKCGGDYA